MFEYIHNYVYNRNNGDLFLLVSLHTSVIPTTTPTRDGGNSICLSLRWLLRRLHRRPLPTPGGLSNGHYEPPHRRPFRRPLRTPRRSLKRPLWGLLRRPRPLHLSITTMASTNPPTASPNPPTAIPTVTTPTPTATTFVCHSDGHWS